MGRKPHSKDAAVRSLKKLGKRLLVSELGFAKPPKFEVFFLSSPQMTLLKRRFYPRKRVAVVDVLSFPEVRGFPNPEASGAPSIGDIYINVIFLRGDFSHVAFLFVHGLLHLLGYDHRKRDATIRMERLEQKLLSAARISTHESTHARRA